MKARALIFVLMFIGELILTTPTLAQEKINVKLSTGFDYSVGDYGRADDTEIWYWPLITKLTYKDWTAKLTVPYLRIKGPGVIVGGGDAGINLSGNRAVTTESGLGDVIGSLTYTLYLEDNNFYLDFTGKIKFPTADEDKGLGTGETDYTIQVDATKMFGSAYIFGGVGRRFMGESSQFQLDDIWLLNVGGGYQINKKFGVGVAYDFRESPSTAADPSEASAYLTYKFSDSVTTMLYGVVGFSDGSPQTGIGLQFSYKFDVF